MIAEHPPVDGLHAAFETAVWARTALGHPGRAISLAELVVVRRGLQELLVPERRPDLVEAARALLARLEEVDRAVARRGEPESSKTER